MGRALELTTTAADARWEETYESLAYTAFALGTHADDAQIQPLLRQVRGILVDWEAIEGDRRKARGAAIATRAEVRVADASLDHTLAELAATVLRLADQRRDAPLYQRLFPEPHEAVIDLGLEGELPAAAVALAQLEEGDDLPDEVRQHTEALRRAVQVGNGALARRGEAYAALGRLQARVESWHENAESTARYIHKALIRLGESRGLSYRWTASFFVDGTPIV